MPEYGDRGWLLCPWHYQCLALIVCKSNSLKIKFFLSIYAFWVNRKVPCPFSVLAIDYRPDGEEIAVASINAQISFWNVHTATQTGSVEGRHDIGYSRKEGEKITAKQSAFGKWDCILFYFNFFIYFLLVFLSEFFLFFFFLHFIACFKLGYLELHFVILFM